MFGFYGALTPDQTKLVSSYKMMIYEGFEKAVKSGLPREMMGILVDEQFGADILAKAHKDGFTTCLCVEKSGQDEFDFEYGKEYAAHIDKMNPDLVKVLVRYNPEGDEALNRRQAAKLTELSQFLDRTGRKYMFELLVPPTEAQLQRCQGNKQTYDLEIRPSLMVRAIKELQAAGVEADVWKIEGVDRKADFEKISEVARANGRDNVACIVLGRGENETKVREWLQVGANVPGVIGFAVGRTVFWHPLKDFKEGKISREEAIDQMAKTYGGFCNFWLQARGQQ